MAMNLRPNHPVGQVLGRLAEQVGAVPADGATLPNVQVTGVTLRGQNTQPGDLFAALPGASSHGGRYAAEAVTQGAVAVLTDPAGVDAMVRAAGAANAAAAIGDIPVLIHPDPRSVLGEVAATESQITRTGTFLVPSSVLALRIVSSMTLKTFSVQCSSM